MGAERARRDSIYGARLGCSRVLWLYAPKEHSSRCVITVNQGKDESEQVDKKHTNWAQ